MREVRARNESGMSPRNKESPSCVTDLSLLDLAVSNLDHHGMVKAGISRLPIVDWDDARSRR